MAEATAAVAYSGHGSTGLAGDGVVALFECDPADELITAMWPGIERGDQRGLLIVLGSRLDSLPGFGLVWMDAGKATVWSRGSVRIEVYQGDQQLAAIVAGQRTTWREDSYDRVDRVVLSAPSGAENTALPLRSGVVRAAWLECGPPKDTHMMPGKPAAQILAPQEERVRIPQQLVQDFAARQEPVEVRPAPEGVRFRLSDLILSNRGGDTELSSQPKPVGNLFVAIQCPQLHLNEPTSPVCRECFLPLDLKAPRLDVPQPALGWLRREGTNERWQMVYASTLIGRSPGQGGVDRLAVALTGVSAAVADLHVEMRLSGFRVEVMDRSGRGDTQVINPDGRRVRLEPGVAQRLRETASMVLADEVTLKFEVGP